MNVPLYVLWKEITDTMIMRLIFIAFTAKLVASCTTSTKVFTTSGSSATIQYNVNSLSTSSTDVFYWVRDPEENTRVQFTMKNGQITSAIQTLNLTFIGNTSTWDLSFRIDNVQTQDTGEYTLVKRDDKDTPLLCNTVYIKGRLSVSNLTSNNQSPSVGESVTLTCSSSSSTVPGSLPLVYTWQVDGATNPADSRYTYSTFRATLTVSDVEKSDADKVFTCSAQEQGSQIISSSSNQLGITVLYGPENARLEPSPSSYNRTENTTLAPITCRADCNPSCTTYTWSHLNSTWSTSTDVLDLGQVSRNEAGVYRCTVTRSVGYTSFIDVTVIVQFPPSSTNLTGNTSILANGINKVTLTCTTSTANPAATISWLRNESPIVNPIQVQETAGDYGGKITSQVLELTPTRDDDGDVYRCTASNNIKSPVTSQQKVLDLKYIPLISISKIQSEVTECTDSITLTCTVSSKPVSTITWKKGQQQLSSASGSNNVGQYRLTNVSRTTSGPYKCVAYNGYGGNVQETVNLTVKYTPDVSVTTRNVTTQEQSVDIVCNPSGEPEQYTFSPWTHQWDINGPVLNHPGLGNSRVLNLTNLTYEHSGVYICNVSNGVDCSRNPDAGSGHVYLVVKAAPVLIDPQPNLNDERIRVAFKINSPAVFNFTFWSNADQLDVQCYRNINGTRQNTAVGSTEFFQTKVKLPVFSSSITTTGQLASLSLQIQQLDDLGSYDIILSNQIGEEKLLAINVVAQGPPQTPVLWSVSVLTPTEVFVNWTRGFHGGLEQTVVIQISTDEVHWENKTEVMDGMTDNLETSITKLQGLSPSSLYYIRLFAYNNEGQSDNYTKVLNFETPSEEPPSSSPVAAIAGGVTGSFAAVVIVVVVLIVLRRRNIIGGKSQDTELVRRPNEESQSQSEDEDIVENMMYVSANEVPSPSTSGQRVDTSAIYSKPVKHGKHVVAASGDVYAVVSKPKKPGVEETKQAPEMPTKKKEKGKKVDKKKEKKAKKSGGDDVYENAPEGATAAANNESIYETTETSPPPKPSRRQNKDGLLYADIEFKPTPQTNGTPVIHGLEDRTLYSAIDFTKEAEPLPESDEENDKPK